MPLKETTTGKPALPDETLLKWMVAELERIGGKLDRATNFAINNKDSLSAHPLGQRGRITGTRPRDLFVVKVEKTGGADGTATTPASWTYTVRGIDWNGTTGSELGTSLAVARPRPNGKMTFQTGTTGYGVAFHDAGTLKLWDAGEIPSTAECA